MQNTARESTKLHKNDEVGTISTNFTIKENKKNGIGEIYEKNNLKLTKIREIKIKDLSKEDFNVDPLPPEIQTLVINFLSSHATAFSKSYNTLGETDAVAPNYKLQHDFPIQTKSYELAHDIQNFAPKEVKDFVTGGNHTA